MRCIYKAIREVCELEQVTGHDLHDVSNNDDDESKATKKDFLLKSVNDP